MDTGGNGVGKRCYYLGLDQGTTGTTALLLDESWHQVARGHVEIHQHYPQNGWVEHDPIEIYDSLLKAAVQARPPDCFGGGAHQQAVWSCFSEVDRFNIRLLLRCNKDSLGASKCASGAGTAGTASSGRRDDRQLDDLEIDQWESVCHGLCHRQPDLPDEFGASGVG